MKTKQIFKYSVNINFKSNLNSRTLKFNLIFIYRREQFKDVQYVTIQIKLGLFKGGRTLGNKKFIDLKKAKI